MQQSDYTPEKLKNILSMVEEGTRLKDALSHYRISKQTYYAWRKLYERSRHIGLHNQPLRHPLKLLRKELNLSWDELAMLLDKSHTLKGSNLQDIERGEGSLEKNWQARANAGLEFGLWSLDYYQAFDAPRDLMGWEFDLLGFYAWEHASKLVPLSTLPTPSLSAFDMVQYLVKRTYTAKDIRSWYIDEQVYPDNTMLGFAHDIFINVTALRDKLKASADPVSAFLWSKFSPTAGKILSYSRTSKSQLCKILADEFNLIIEMTRLYDAECFKKNVQLSEETRLLAEGLSEDSGYPQAFNCKLLQDAYPDQFKHPCRDVGRKEKKLPDGTLKMETMCYTHESVLNFSGLVQKKEHLFEDKAVIAERFFGNAPKTGYSILDDCEKIDWLKKFLLEHDPKAFLKKNEVLNNDQWQIIWTCWWDITNYMFHRHDYKPCPGLHLEEFLKSLQAKRPAN